MFEQSGRDRTIPLLVTLLAVSIVIMTFDIRASGEGVVGSLRTGVNRILEPVQVAASAVVNPVADLVGNLRDVAGLRAENEALRAELAEAQAELASVEDRLERLEVLERLHDLELDLADLTTTNANVVGLTDSFDQSFRIDRGMEAGILEGHPVLDVNGYVVGRVLESWRGGAIVVPLVGDVEAITVSVGDQVGTLQAVVGSEELVLEVLENAEPVEEGDQVVTSSFSSVFPPSIPVGVIAQDARPQGQALTASVEPYADISRLRVVVVVAWPPDPSMPSTTTTTTTTTTLPAEEDAGGDG